ncbi:single-stranded DNA-binding protein [Campylobacter hyointestinalis]|uniref:Single-stranded DNA-binding protein n=1 Tax=Campylobacter hyointestinalis TaxID=198 RepID=A0A562X7K3_CAMHY|nr:single-stranded DNA-binding protein [Campylobacter hyointestinalis]TWO17995.1 single-stranded DNA-binding protein [Campylobacter hyointestinalis]
MFNKVILVGNLSKDITLKSGGSMTIANTTIAVNRKFKTQSGGMGEEVLFIDITFFAKQAEVANQYLKKGSKLLIEGRLKLDTWQDQQGNNRSKHSVIVENMEMLGNKENQENTDNQAKNDNQTKNDNKYYETDNDTIPF